MTFRRLYWITESLHEDGTSEATGVYTSIYDLIHRGLPRHTDGLRLTLAKADAEDEPLGRFVSPAFEGLAEALLPLVQTEETTEEGRQALLKVLQERSTVNA